MGWLPWNRGGARRGRVTIQEPDATENGFFRLFGGRQHHAGVPYILPADTQEINRIDFQHYMLRYMLRGN